MRLSDRLQGLCAQSWARTGLGKKPYNARKYGIMKPLLLESRLSGTTTNPPTHTVSIGGTTKLGGGRTGIDYKSIFVTLTLNHSVYSMKYNTFSLDMGVFIAQKPGKWSTSASLLPFLLHLVPFSYHFFCFFASSCLQISLFTDLLEGVLSYNPPVRKSAFLTFDHFPIEIEPPPPSLQHCQVETIKVRRVLALGAPNSRSDLMAPAPLAGGSTELSRQAFVIDFC